MAELARLNPDELSTENPVFRWLSNIGGLTTAEKLQRAQDRRAAMSSSFARPAPIVSGMPSSPAAMSVSPPMASANVVQPQVVSPAPAPTVAATPPGQNQGAVGFRPRPVQAVAPGGSIGVNLTPQDRALKQNMQAIDDAIAGGMTPTPTQAAQIAGLRRQAGFLRGGTDRVPVGPDGLPISRGLRYLVAGSPEAVSRFTSAVAPSEYGAEATAARTLQQQQFDERNAARPMMPAAPQPLPAPQTLGEAFMRRGALREAEGFRQDRKLAAEIAASQATAGIAAERNRIAAAETAAGAGMRSSQMDLNAALARKAEADAAAGKYIRLKREVPTGEIDELTKAPVMRTEEFLYDQSTKQFVDPAVQAGGPTVQTPTAATIAKMKANKGNAAMEKEYKAQFGKLPY